MDKKWLEWSMRIQAIAQSGRAYSENKYDIERYEQLQDLAAEILANYSNHNFSELRDFLEKETGYATPKIDVRGVVFREDKILLVREIVDNRWTLPGGWADVHATAAENVVREIFEESGFETKATRLLAVYDRSRHGHQPVTPLYVYKIFFLCEITGGSAKTSMETSAVDFFDLDNLPGLSLGRVTAKQIRRMFVLRDLERADFD